MAEVEVTGIEEEEGSEEFNWKCSRLAGSFVLAVESGDRGGEEEVWDSARGYCWDAKLR